MDKKLELPLINVTWDGEPESDPHFYLSVDKSIRDTMWRLHYFNKSIILATNNVVVTVSMGNWEDNSSAHASAASSDSKKEVEYFITQFVYEEAPEKLKRQEGGITAAIMEQWYNHLVWELLTSQFEAHELDEKFHQR